jgi:hypothetical protein
MKKGILIIILLLPILLTAQNTWVQKLTYNYNSGGYYDSIAGVKKAEVGSDGSLYVLAFLGNHGGQKIFKFSPNSHHYEWDIDAGNNGSQVAQWVDQFHATSDSGIILCYNIKDEMMTGNIFGYLKKYSKDGTIEWSHQFGDWDYTQNVFDVIEKNSGGYYALIEDSIYTLDNSGNVIDSSGAVSGERLLEVTNGDLLVLTHNNQLIRTDTSGNIIWTQNCYGLFAYDTSSVFILNSTSSIQKVDALSGTQSWNVNYGFTPISEIEATHDGGFIASVGIKPTTAYGGFGTIMPGTLFRADSIGDTLWTRTYLLPHYGLSTFKLMPDGNLFTGGCYLSGYVVGYPFFEKSAFCCMMNSDGSYPLQQTGYVGPKDANHDHISDFLVDALEAMLSLGQTGPGRDTTIYGNQSPCERNDIAIDWTTNSISGANNKYSDFDGSGIIDTNDISFCDMNGYVDSFPSVYRQQNPNYTQSTEEFCLIPIEDTIAPGDTAYYYMVLGASGNPVDSIYGFAFTYNNDDAGNNPADSAFLYATNFGTPGQNLFLNHRHNVSMYYGQEFRSRTLVCRTNFQNAYSVFDTVGFLRFRLSNFIQSITPTIKRFKAILVDGSEIPFNICVGTVIVDSTLLSTNEKHSTNISVFPNPASDYIEVNIKGSGQTEFQIINSLGEVIEIFHSDKSLKIHLQNYPDGIFLLKTISDLGMKAIPFIVKH